MDRELRRAVRACGACVFVLALLAGCGGKSSHTATPPANTGSAVINIEWPPRAAEGRVIPAATTTIVLHVYADQGSGSQELTSLRQELTRPADGNTSEVHLTGLPTGPVLFTAEALDAARQLLASGSQTVSIPADGSPATVSLDLVPTAAGSIGFAVVTVTNIPTPAGSSPITVEVKALQNGQAITTTGMSSTASFDVSPASPVSSVPLRLGPLPPVSLAFVATVKSSTGALLASGSAVGTVSVASDVAVTVQLAASSGGSSSGGTGSGGADTTATPPSAVVNVMGIGDGSDFLRVTPRLVGGNAGDDPTPIQFVLRRSSQDLQITRVPILIQGLSAGSWVFEVVGCDGEPPDVTAALTNVKQVGAASAVVEAGQRALLDVRLSDVPGGGGGSSTAEGKLTVRTTNITGVDNNQPATLLVALFNSQSRVDGSIGGPQLVNHIPSVSERELDFGNQLPTGPYTVVSALYQQDKASLQTALAATDGIPAGAVSVGSATIRVEPSPADNVAEVELRLQPAVALFGSVNLAMTQVPVRTELVQVGDTGTTEERIVSGLVIRVFSVNDNQEIPSLRTVMVPPQVLVAPNATAADKVVRLRLPAVPAGLMRFEVTSTANQNGTGGVLGSGSCIATVAAASNAAAPPVTAVTVALLPHGDLPPGTVLPGTSNPTDPDNNPEPPTPARFRTYLRGLLRRR